jgi:hypothetical protein
MDLLGIEFRQENLYEFVSEKKNIMNVACWDTYLELGG